MQNENETWLRWVDEIAENDFVVVDNFFSEEAYFAVRNYFFESLPNFSKAGIGALNQNVIINEARGDDTFWLHRHRDTNLNAFWKTVDEAIFTFNRYCFLSLSGYEFHFAHYPPGGHYEKHLDQFKARNNRMITMVIYLNENWQKGDGGELEVYLKDGKTTLVDPLANRAIMFKSAEVPHAVLKSTKDRYSLTGWLLYTPSALGQFLG